MDHEDTTSRHRRNVRVYQSVRTAHLERFAVLEPATVYFVDTSYDFEDALTEQVDVRRCASLWQLFRRLLVTRVDTLEVNEPLMVPGLKIASVAVAAVRLHGLLHRHRTEVVTYAIENSDPYENLRDQLRWRLPFYRVATALLVRQLDRVAFGTTASHDTYRPHLGPFRGSRTDVPALPSPCHDCPEAPTEPDRVVFVGAFNERKGVRQLVDAWPRVRRLRPEARLRILGKGALQPVVDAAAGSDPTLEVVVDPERARIHRELRSAKVAVLLSQPWRGWREQVGLPIVEALAHGCLVVTTDETGLATWLAEHGHPVVPARSGPEAVAAAVADALASPRSPESVRADLPGEDGRLAADRWMFHQGGPGPAADEEARE